MHATAIIGAGWGDEGKGLMTDYFASQQSRYRHLNVRFNGGAQAGHTVEYANARHVFSHFGAASFRAVRTFLPHTFITNPELFCLEHGAIAHSIRGVSPYADSNGLMSTPYDVMLNMMVEESRNAGRHGSCGVGVFETIVRNRHPAYETRVNAVNSETKLRTLVGKIRDEYVPLRANELGIDIPDNWKRRIGHKKVIETYIENVQNFRRNTTNAAWSTFADHFGMQYYSYLFEGAQGLMLSEKNTEFAPHLTPSDPGLGSVANFVEHYKLNGQQINCLDVIYVVRAYATRHGPGFFPRQVDGLKFEDKTNLANDWQGSLRFGQLDLSLLKKYIDKDWENAKKFPFQVRKGLAITCMDQVIDGVDFWLDDTLCSMPASIMADIAYETIGAELRYQSFGPTADEVVRVE